MEEAIKLAIIGGSGLYNMDGLKATKEYKAETPFGTPSAPIVVGNLEDQRVAFLARHGAGHHHHANRSSISRQYLCAEIARRGTHHQYQRLWFPA